MLWACWSIDRSARAARPRLLEICTDTTVGKAPFFPPFNFPRRRMICPPKKNPMRFQIPQHKTILNFSFISIAAINLELSISAEFYSHRETEREREKPNDIFIRFNFESYGDRATWEADCSPYRFVASSRTWAKSAKCNTRNKPRTFSALDSFCKPCRICVSSSLYNMSTHTWRNSVEYTEDPYPVPSYIPTTGDTANVFFLYTWALKESVSVGKFNLTANVSVTC